MIKDFVITIGREYGSGGKYIGEQVAKKLNIPFYDKELITRTYEKSGCNYSKLTEYDETKRNKILKLFDLFNMDQYADGLSSDVYQSLMNNTIKEVSQNGPCVILGRNSNRILKNDGNAFHIFIYSNNLDFKVKRKMDLLHMGYDETLKKLKQIDKQRKNYYESFDKNSSWGNIREYDFCIDSSILGVDGTVDFIVNIYMQLSNKH